MHSRSCDSIDGRLRNCTFKKDIHYTLQACQWFLKPIGVWPLVCTRSSGLEQIAGVALMTMCFCSMLFIILPSGHFFFFVDDSISRKVKFLGPVAFCAWSTIKYCYLGLKRALFGQCIRHVERDWRNVESPNHRNIMLKYVRISRNLTIVCAVFLYTGGILYHTVMQLLSKERGHANDTFKPLIYPGYNSFLDTQSSPTYEVVYSIHCFAALIMYSITTGAYSLAAIFVNHVCGQIEIQIARLNDLLKRREENVSRDPLAIIVYNHVRVLRFSKNIEAALREICLTEIVESTLILCYLEYYCVMEWQKNDAIAILTHFILLVSFTFNIFIFCYIGEILHEQCSHIGAASYEIRWYDLPARRAYDLILLNAISQYPPKLTAGKIIELSLNTFSTVVKSSVIYFNLLRRVMNW